MKILITGGAGFIGSAVVRLAIERGHSVVNIDALTYAACPENVSKAGDHPNYTFEHADIRDRIALDRTFAAHQPDAVMHLAAESHVDRSIDEPADFIETNVRGTFNMLEAARIHWASHGSPEAFRFHHVSTDEVFGSLPDNPNIQFTEDTPYDPRSPYAASKAAIETFTIGLAKEVGPDGIRVNALQAGTTDTEIHAAAGNPGRPAMVAANAPLRRVATPEDIAAGIMWLASAPADYVSGAILPVSGGL